MVWNRTKLKTIRDRFGYHLWNTSFFSFYFFSIKERFLCDSEKRREEYQLMNQFDTDFLSSSFNFFPFFGRPARYSLFHHERTPPKTNYVTSLEQAFIGGSFLFVQFQDVFQDDYRLFLHVQAFTSRIFPQNPEPHLSWTISCLSFIGL